MVSIVQITATVCDDSALMNGTKGDIVVLVSEGEIVGKLERMLKSGQVEISTI